MDTTLAEAVRCQLSSQIEELVMSTPVMDVHTHLYDPALQGLLLSGIDDLLAYHYLVAEVFRQWTGTYQEFWSLSKSAQAEVIWEELFLKHSPISEACRGVLTTLHLLGLDPAKRDLPALRKWFAAQKPDAHLSRCLELAGIRRIYMTNSPFDDTERPVWEKGFRRDPRFEAGLRIDPLVLAWPEAAQQLSRLGFEVRPQSPSTKTFDEVRRFLREWSERLEAKYLMISLPPDFQFPGQGYRSGGELRDKEAAPEPSPLGKRRGRTRPVPKVTRTLPPDLPTQLLEHAVLPHCREFGLPFALMPGVKRAVNPQLKLAGDGVGLSDLTTLQNLCARYPENKFIATILARENQHEACVLARKFRNLHIFGCWWFMNVPSLVEEVTRMRLELLGLSFTAQHSDARVLEQVIYKWHHSRKILARVLVEKYSALAETGWRLSRSEVARDVRDLFGGAFERFCGIALG